ncbi:MAG: FlgD immunoglobulin-like domain containing protein [Candidatus Zixiibacteriota bacterium]
MICDSALARYFGLAFRKPTVPHIILLSACLGGSIFADTPQLLGIIKADTTNVLFGSELLPLRDQDGDGINELIISNGRGSNYLYRGGRSFDTLPYWKFDSTNSYGGAGDVNGDGWDDLMLRGRSSFGWKTGVYYGGPLRDTVRDFNLGADANPPDLYPMIGKDLNSNGFDEIIIDRFNFGEVQIFEIGAGQDTLLDMILRQHELPPVSAGSFGYQTALGDFNGDAKQDLAVSHITQVSQPNKGRVYLYWGGPGFDTLPDFTIYRRGPYDTVFHSSNNFGEVMTCPGDLNGDGYDDLFVSSGFQDDTGWFYFGGPVMDTVPDLYMTMMPNHAAPAGDINGDGYADLIVSHATAWSGEGFVLVYYGGPNVDAQWDIGLFVGNEPGYHIYWGMDVAGLGDFNGDSINDFAFTTYNEFTQGLVYIYSGTGVATDVEEPVGDTSDYSSIGLRSYPNPFNQSTTISLGLKRSAQVRLAIYDVLGREVAVLANKRLSAGMHEFPWHGVTSNGSPVATGVYMCLATVDSVKETRKLLFLK